MSRVTADTRVFAILGDPVSHSRSPLVHNAALAHQGIDAVYVAMRSSAETLPGNMRGLALAGGGGNVTIPHKGLAAATLDVASARVKATQACNTFFSRRGRLYGDNTDVAGFRGALKQVLADVRGARVLILGAGGGARSVLYALLDDGASDITVLGRSRGRAREIADTAGRHAHRVHYINSDRHLLHEGFDLVVNTTPLGLRARDRIPLRFARLGALTAVFDIVYRPGGTRWSNYAREIGIPAADGAEMLIGQAAAAYELWFEQEAPVDVMRAAFLAE